MSLRHHERASSSRHVPHTRIENEDDIDLRYIFGETLGKGSFGTVILAHRDTDQSEWAVKIINKEKAGSAAVKLMEREVSIMKKVVHPNIIHLEEVFETTNKMFLVMELCDRDCLEDIILKTGPLPEQDALCIVCQLTDAVAYIHENDIIHRDLKLDNILLAKPSDGVKYNIKLTDFGLSYTRGGSGSDYMMNQMVGTPIYMAPEVITNYGYSQQCDIWSIGVIMYKLIGGIPPFFANTEEELFDLIQKGDIKYNGPWENVSQAAKQLVECMMKVDPAHRLTSKEILTHPWIKGEQDVNGMMTTNVLEMMKQYRLEQEELQERDKQIETTISVCENNNSEAEEVQKEEISNSGSSKKCSSAKKKNETETSSVTRTNSGQLLSSGTKNDTKSSSRNNTERKLGNGSTKSAPSYMQPTKSSRAPKNPNTKGTKKTK